MSGRKRLGYSTGKIGAVSAELCEQLKRNTKRSAVVHHRSGFDDGARFECSDGERRMAVANPLCQRGSKCVTAAQLKSPMMAWSTVCDDYFRVTNNTGVRDFSREKSTLANLALLHRRKIRRPHIQHVYFFHEFGGRIGVLSDQLLKIWVGPHSIPILVRFLPAGMSHDENECVVPSGRPLGRPVTHNLQIVFGE